MNDNSLSNLQEVRNKRKAGRRCSGNALTPVTEQVLG
jgi:hypothetical protein